jgi:thiol:disulfide interchange protein DsbD
MALPFLLLGGFPALLRALPRSGDWMEAAKVTMGILELQLVVYYLAKSDWGWGIGVLNRAAILALWLALAAFAAAYLAGWVRLPGHGGEGRPGKGRIAAGLAAAALAAFLLAGLSGTRLGFLESLVPPEARRDDFEAGLREAKASGRPLFLEFTGFT